MTAFWREASLEELPAQHPGASAAGVLWQATEAAFVLDVPGLARCEARDGEPVRVARAPGAHAVDPRLIVQGLPLAAHWMQRGKCACHAAAIATPRGAVLFAGTSGMGKSTLAAIFARKGCAILADEVTPLEPVAPAGLHVLPAMPDVLLWNDVAVQLGFSPVELEPARPGLPRSYARGLPVSITPQPVHAIYLLNVHHLPQADFTVLTGQERVRAVLMFAFDRQIPIPPALRHRTFMQLCAALPRIRVVRVTRPDRGLPPGELAMQIEQDWSQ